MKITSFFSAVILVRHWGWTLHIPCRADALPPFAMVFFIAVARCTVRARAGIALAFALHMRVLTIYSTIAAGLPSQCMQDAMWQPMHKAMPSAPAFASRTATHPLRLTVSKRPRNCLETAHYIWLAHTSDFEYPRLHYWVGPSSSEATLFSLSTFSLNEMISKYLSDSHRVRWMGRRFRQDPRHNPTYNLAQAASHTPLHS